MIQIYSNYNGKVINITNLCSSVEASGSKSNVARQLDITMVYGIYNKNVPKIMLSTGEVVKAFLDGVEIFRGIIMNQTLKTDNTINITCFDYCWYLTQSKVTFNFKNTTADKATRDILTRLDKDVQIGYLYPSNVVVNRLIAQKSAYDSIMELYTEVSKQYNVKFYLFAGTNTINVSTIGGQTANTIIKPCTNINKLDGNLISLEYKEDMSNMINRIEIYDSNNNWIDTVIDPESNVNFYGVIQDNYVQEADKDYRIVATNKLHGIDKDVTVEVLGNFEYFTGKAVKVQIPFLEYLKDVTMYVVGDSHTWDINTGKYKTTLNLSYNITMDEKEVNG